MDESRGRRVLAGRAGNPYMPEWEHVPDGEPYVFADPDRPGRERLYVYGSHDTHETKYCGTDLVLWSAPVEDLTDWRHDGRIFAHTPPGADDPDTFYAPDVATVEEPQPDGTTRTAYYLYPQDMGAGRSSMVARSYRPDGPFEVLNWTDDTQTSTVGDLGFDPAVFVDDDGRVYGYWGFQRSYAAEMEPDMYRVKPGTQVTDMIASCKDDSQVWRFFEASSLRRIEDSYVFVYSRVTLPGEGGLDASNATLAYAYAKNPLGPWTYGGTVVDARAPETGEHGEPITTMASNNTHGSIVRVGSRWYVFYHRAVSGGFARQAMAEPVDVTVAADGAVRIVPAEVTSQGLATDGLDPYATTSAGLACWVTGGSQVPRIDNPRYPDENGATAPVTDNTDGSIVGFKYFRFVPAGDGTTTQVSLHLTPRGVDGTIEIWLDRPWGNEHNAGTKIGSLDVAAGDPQHATIRSTLVPALDALDGKHAIYLVCRTSGDASVADLHGLTFSVVPGHATTTATSPRS